jgi:hypothetical protein
MKKFYRFRRTENLYRLVDTEEKQTGVPDLGPKLLTFEFVANVEKFKILDQTLITIPDNLLSQFFVEVGLNVISED